MNFNLRYISNSKKGINRERNQDSFLIIENESYYFFILFDGVSSNPLSFAFINEYKKRLKLKIKNTQICETNLSQLLYDTNNDLLNLGIDGMSTLSMLFFNNLTSSVNFINIGDSRIYIYTNQFLEKITIDDSLVGRKNVITKCLGMKSLTIGDFKINKISSEYNYLMCSDGFYGLMEDNLKQYFESLNFRSLKNVKKKLSVLQRKMNDDDSSYIIIKNEIPN